MLFAVEQMLAVLALNSIKGMGQCKDLHTNEKKNQNKITY